MQLIFPIMKPLSFIKESVEALEYQMTKPQIMNLTLILTAIITCSSLSLTTLSRAMLGRKSVNALSHFFSYAGLNAQKIMCAAVRWAIRKMNLFGASVRLAIDDTMKHHSRGAKKISNVYWLFDHVTQANCNASCIVFVYLVINERIRFPIGWRVYKKKGKSKWKLALEIIDEVIEMDLEISVVLFDSWFTVRGFLKQLEKRKITFIGDVKSSLTLECCLPDKHRSIISLKIGEIVKYGKCLFKEVFLGLKSNQEKQPEKVLYKTYSKIVYIKAFQGKYLLIHSIDQRTDGFKTFICNELTWEAQKVLKEYSYRWMIEEFFGNAKGLCGLEDACIRSEQGGAIALFLVSYVDILVSVKLWKGIHDNSEGKLPTVSCIFAAASEENLRTFLESSEKEADLEKIVAFWSESLKKAKAKTRRVRKSLVKMDNSESLGKRGSEAANQNSHDVMGVGVA
jgi:hypothetical protein